MSKKVKLKNPKFCHFQLKIRATIWAIAIIFLGFRHFRITKDHN